MEDFTTIMVTNALSPLRVIEALSGSVTATGLIGAMTSGQGSITNNTTGGREVYRGSKAALNMFLRCFAAREAPPAAGSCCWPPGGSAPTSAGTTPPTRLEETVPLLVDVLLAKRGRPGLEYLDRFGQVVPW